LRRASELAPEQAEGADKAALDSSLEVGAGDHVEHVQHATARAEQ
jgi:hypothetical protein